MRLPAIFTAAILAFAPGLAMAECSWGKMDQTVASCAAGTTWDAASQSCVTAITG